MKSLLCAVAISAVAFYYGTGLHPHWWMTWLAPIPVLIVSYRSSNRAAFVTAFLSFLLGELNLWNYFKVLEVPISVRLFALISIAAVFALGALLSRAFFVRGHRLLATLAPPVVFVSFEFAMSFGRNGTALNLAYSQMDCLPLIQLASVTGLWAISFFVLFVASALAQLLDPRTFTFRVFSTTAAISLVIFGSGFIRLNSNPTGPEVRIGLAASDQRPLLGNESKAVAITDSYVKAIGELAKQGASIIVLPEKILTTTDYKTGEFYRRIREAALRNSVNVIAGVDQRGTPLKHNLALSLAPSHVLVYEKHHMVVGWEDGYEVGRSTLMFLAPNENVGVAICKDMDFPRLSRTYAYLDTQLMLVPAWDFDVDDWLHSRMAIMRSVEGGFAMARSAKQGFMTINDNRGRVLFQVRSDATGSAHLLGTIKLSIDRTIYSRFGDWFAWLNLFALAALLASLSLIKRATVTLKTA